MMVVLAVAETTCARLYGREYARVVVVEVEAVVVVAMVVKVGVRQDVEG